MRSRIFAAACLPIALAGCATSGFPGARPLTYRTPGEARIYATGRPCIHEPAGNEAAGLVAALLTTAASKLLENFGTALSEGAKGGQLPSSVATSNLQLPPGASPKCIVFVRGSFNPADGQAPIDLPLVLSLAGDNADARSRLDQLGLPPIYRLDQFVELRLSNSSSNTALTFAPVYALVGRSVDGSTSGERDLSIALKANKAGSDGVGGVVLLPDRRLGFTGQIFEPNASGRYLYESPWFAAFNPAAKAAPAASAGNGDLNPPATRPGSSVVSMHHTGSDAVPVTLTVTVVETRRTNEGLAFIASVFGALRPKLEEVAREALDDGAAATAEAADLTLQATYATSEGTARAALIAYCRSASTSSDAAGSQDRTTKSANARSAQITANAAALRAGAPQPFSNLVLISGAPVTANTAGCSGV